MGWASGDFEGRLTARAVVAFVFSEAVAQRHLLDAVRDRDVVYAAVRCGGTQKVWGFVLIIKREGKRLHVKRISEDMGPYDDHCPSRILDLLSEPSNELARDWRARCRAQGDQKREVGRSDEEEPPKRLRALGDGADIDAETDCKRASPIGR